MKAERRHELQENDLAHMIEAVRTNLAQNARPIGIGVLVVVAVFVVAGLALRSNTVAQEDRWRRLAQLMFDKPETARESLEALVALSKDTADSNFALAALMELGRQSLNWSQKPETGLDPVLTEKARYAFEDMLRRFPENPMAVGFSRSGLATVEENSFILDRKSRHKEEARRHLKAIVDDPKMNGMPYQRMALDRLAVIDRTFTFVPLAPTRPEEPSAAAVKPMAPAFLPGASFKLDPGTVQVEPANDPTKGANVNTADDEEIDPADNPVPKPNTPP